MPRRRRRAWWAVVPFAVLGAVGLGLLIAALPAITVWMTSPGTTATWAEPARLTVLSWVIAHDVPVSVGRSVYSLLPWGFVVLWAWLCWRTSRWSARIIGILDVRDAATVALGFATGYALVVAGTTWAVTVWANAAGEALRASPIRALGIAFVVAFASGFGGVLSGAGLRDEAWAQVPEPLRALLRAAAGGLLVLFATACVVLAVGLILGFDRAVAVQQGLNAGAVGGLVLLVIGLGYLPVAIVWTASYALGTGLNLGTDVVTSPFADAAGQALLPSFPLLAALPERTFPGSWALPVLGVIAGITMGRLAARRGVSLINRVSVSVGAALLGALVVSILARVSNGSLGHVHLVALGPASQQVAWAAVLTFVLGAIPAASLGRSDRRRAHLAPVRESAGGQLPVGSEVAVDPSARVEPPVPIASAQGYRQDTVVVPAPVGADRVDRSADPEEHRA